MVTQAGEHIQAESEGFFEEHPYSLNLISQCWEELAEYHRINYLLSFEEDVDNENEGEDGGFFLYF
jgi:hypothetical protein